MSQHAAPPLPSTQNPWAKRLWWMVPAGCFVLLAAVLTFTAGIFILVFSLVKSSGAYEQAMEIATAHPSVIEAVGEPVEARWFVMGSIQTSGPTGEAAISIPIKGPDGKGTVHVIAEKRGGEWIFETLTFEDDSGGLSIDLLEE